MCFISLPALSAQPVNTAVMQSRADSLPHLSVPLRSADHFAGRDPVLDAVFEEIRTRR
ncbi:MAG: hypothetical protein ACT4PM_12585 [Gemmatimonadales bacterium]